VRSIPTEYAGVQFRSRLEATWAYNLDGWGLKWSYEPEAFAFPSGANYLPDFWIPASKTWLEIKGPGLEGLDKTREFAKLINEDRPGNTVFVGLAPVGGCLRVDTPDLLMARIQHQPMTVVFTCCRERQIALRHPDLTYPGCGVCGVKMPSGWVDVGERPHWRQMQWQPKKRKR
jgi:hypothetical protein